MGQDKEPSENFILHPLLKSFRCEVAFAIADFRMAKAKLLLICGLLLLWGGLLQAGTYTLADGQTVTGEPVSYSRDGLTLKSGGTFLPRTPWEKFSQEALKQLVAEAKRPADAAMVQPFLEEMLEFERKQAVKKDITVTPPDRVELPTGRTGIIAAIGTPLGFFLFFVVYGASLYAAYEIAVYRNQAPGLVIGVSAVLPVIGPVIFLSMPTKHVPAHDAPADIGADGLPEEPVQAAQPLALPGQPHAAAAMAQEAAAAAVAAGVPAAPTVVTFRKGEFIFNRRFFETKAPGFLKVVPGEAEKGMVLYVRCLRGEFIGKKIANLGQNEMNLLVVKDHAMAEEMIPFIEIQEVQIREG